MKKLFSILCIALSFACTAFAQNSEGIKERKQLARESVKELNSRAVKLARKEAKALQKEGWTVSPGQLPIDKQLDKLYKLYYEYDADGMPSYIVGESRSTSNLYDAAKMQALNNAKVELAGMIETEVTALTESTVSNNMLSREDATFINNAVRTSKTLIVQNLGRTLVVLDCQRPVGSNQTEVCVRVAYKVRSALQTAGEVIKAQLAASGHEMDSQVDKVWSGVDNL